MALLADVAAGVNIRCIIGKCFFDGSICCQFFIIHFNQSFSLFKNVFIFCNNQGNSVANKPSDIAFGNHHIPVLHNVADLVVRNIIGSVNCNDTGQIECFWKINIQNTGSGISWADSWSIQHAFHLHIIRIKTGACNFFSHVITESRFPNPIFCTFFTFAINFFITTQNSGRQLNSLNNFLISGASANVCAQSFLYIFFTGIAIIIN